MAGEQEFSAEAREQAIRRAGLAMESAYGDYKRTGSAADLDRAYQHLGQMRQLIGGRRPEYVAALETQRGLS